MRILLKLEYVGTYFHGLQRQKNLRSVQGETEEAVFQLTGERVTLSASGRTDAGVHALCQMVHFDTPSRIPVYQYILGLNHYLPEDVKVQDAWEVDPDFHARFDVREKTYRYQMYVSRTASPIKNLLALQVVPPIDVEKMIRAAAYIPGTHDFDRLRSVSETAKTTIRTIREAKLEQSGEDLTFTITGNGFLYNMVRITVGTLISIGYGRFPEDWFLHLFEDEGALQVGKCVSGHGLFLADVKY